MYSFGSTSPRTYKWISDEEIEFIENNLPNKMPILEKDAIVVPSHKGLDENEVHIEIAVKDKEEGKSFVYFKKTHQ